MTYNKKDTRIEDDGCEECGSKNAKYDSKLGEKACADCGLVDVNYSPIDNVADSISQGAERQMERVGRGSSPGPELTAMASKSDTLSPSCCKSCSINTVSCSE